MPVKLYYFDGRGMSEPIRLLLSYGGVEFEDIRVPITMPPVVPEEIKSKCRWGQVPLVELEDGTQLNQSLAITRYFARKFNLIPDDPYQAALCDEYVDAVRDFMNGLFGIAHTRDEKEQQEKIHDYLKINKPKYLDKLESIVKANGGRYLVGSSLTWADIFLASNLGSFHIVFGFDPTMEYPSLKELRTNVESIPGIKAWLQKRPKTKF